MIHNNMYIFRLMVYAQQIKESKLREITRDGKSPRSDESSKPRSKKRSYNKDSSMGNNDGFSNPNS